jgi:hypothetical protein
VAQFRQAVFRRLAGYEDVNDAERLAHGPAMRWVVGGRAVTGHGASSSQMGRFETAAMTAETNRAALMDLSGRWIDRVHARRPVKIIVLGQQRQPDLRRARGRRLQRPFRLHLLSPVVRLQPVRRSGALWPASRQRP